MFLRPDGDCPASQTSGRSDRMDVVVGGGQIHLDRAGQRNGGCTGPRTLKDARG